MSHTLAYAAIVVLLPWAWARLSQLLATRDAADPAAAQSRPRWLVIVRRLEGLVALASLLVTIRFLQRGGRGAPSPQCCSPASRCARPAEPAAAARL